MQDNKNNGSESEYEFLAKPMRFHWKVKDGRKKPNNSEEKFHFAKKVQFC